MVISRMVDNQLAIICGNVELAEQLHNIHNILE